MSGRIPQTRTRRNLGGRCRPLPDPGPPTLASYRPYPWPHLPGPSPQDSQVSQHTRNPSSPNTLCAERGKAQKPLWRSEEIQPEATKQSQRMAKAIWGPKKLGAWAHSISGGRTCPQHSGPGLGLEKGGSPRPCWLRVPMAGTNGKASNRGGTGDRRSVHALPVCCWPCVSRGSILLRS